MEIGDRVRIVDDLPTVDGLPTIDPRQLFEVLVINSEEDDRGKVLGLQAIREDGSAQRFLGGHECDGAAELGSGWWSRPEYVELV